MKLNELLTLDCTLCAVPATSKKRIFNTICTLAAKKIHNCDAHDLLESLIAREKVGTTGIGNGIAIPHGRLNSNNSQVVAILVTTEQAISYEAVDNKAVDIFIALFVPEDSCKQHLTTLQSIAKLFSDKQICKQVRQCQSNQELFDLVQQVSAN